MSCAEAQQPSRGQTRRLIVGTELLKNSFCQSVHIKTTNSAYCPSKFVSRRISLLVCCTEPNRIAGRPTYPQCFAIYSKALLYQGVHDLHNSSVLNCRQRLWSAHSPHSLMPFCLVQLASPPPHCLLRRCVCAVLQAQMVVRNRFHKLYGRFSLLRGLALVSRLLWDQKCHLPSEMLCCFLQTLL